MRHRTRKQAFHPHWLGVALKALGLHLDASTDPLTLQIELPEGSLMLNLSPSGVEAGTLDSRGPDVRLRSTATGILGLAAGELDWNAAVRSGLEVEGSKTAIGVLRTSLNKTRLASTATASSAPGSRQPASRARGRG
jgi:hypothetical protein